MSNTTINTAASSTNTAALRGVDLVIAVGSVDGVLTTSALLAMIGVESEVEVCFTQAFTVDKLPTSSWSGRKVAFVDLAVNNRDPGMTAAFVAALREGGNTLVAVIDEHDRAAWSDVLGSFDGLAVEPQSQAEGEFGSSGAVLAAALDDDVSDHVRQLLQDADAGDRMDFSGRFGAPVNAAMKADIRDNNRRVHLARWFAINDEPDEQIAGWVREYEAIMANHERILAAAEDIGDGMVRADSTEGPVDATTLFFALYRRARVVVLRCQAFGGPGVGMVPAVSVATSDRGLDLKAALVAAEVPFIGGFAQKMNVAPEHEVAAVNAVRALLTAD